MTNLEKYTFPTRNGQLLSTESFSNGNMLRSTAELLFLTKLNNELSPKLRQEYFYGIYDLEQEPGLYSRYPDSVQNSSVDDYLLIGTDRLFASEILSYARYHFGFVDVNKKKDFKQFFPRFQGLWQHLRISANENVGILGQLIWSISLYLAAQKPITEKDNWVLSHVMVLTYERSSLKSYICNLAVKYWRSKKTKTTSQIMSEYTGIPDHPLVKAWIPYN